MWCVEGVETGASPWRPSRPPDGSPSRRLPAPPPSRRPQRPPAVPSGRSASPGGGRVRGRAPAPGLAPPPRRRAPWSRQRRRRRGVPSAGARRPRSCPAVGTTPAGRGEPQPESQFMRPDSRTMYRHTLKHHSANVQLHTHTNNNITRVGMQRSKCTSLLYLSRLFYFILVTKYNLKKVLLLVRTFDLYF